MPTFLIMAFLFFAPILFTSCGIEETLTTASYGAATALSLPSGLDVVARTSSSTTTSSDPKNNSRSIGSRLYSSSGTDYSNQTSQFHIWHPALESLNTPDEILCFLGKLKYDTMMNKGTYVAMVDDSDCGTSSSSGAPSQSSQSGSSGASSATSLQKVFVTSTRQNVVSPHIVKIWFKESASKGGGNNTIKVTVVITEAPSSAKKYGEFVLTFGMYALDGTKLGGGILSTAEGTTERPIALTFVETFEEESNNYSHTTRSSIEMAVDSNGNVTQGKAAIEKVENQNGSISGGGYVLSYQGDRILIDSGNDLSEVDLSSPVCMGIGDDDLIKTVHSYNLYDYTTGKLIKINSGFPFTYTNQDNEVKYGQLGYYGMWTEDSTNSGLVNGSSITKIDWQNPENSQSYTLFQSPGILVKNTIKQLNLDDIDGIEFNYWDWNSQVNNGANIVKYLEAADASASGGAGFYKVGTLVWSSNGPPSKTYTAVSKIDTTNPNYTQLDMQSDQLRGGVRYVNGDTYITYYERSNLMPTATDFTTSTLTLYCLRDCLKVDATQGDLENWGGIFLTQPTGTTDVHTYTIANTDMSLKYGGSAVGLATGVTYSGSYEYGIRSGAMVTAATLATLTDINDIYDNAGTVFYEWEQSDNSWGKLNLAKDSQGNFIEFDQPLKISYQHTTANDLNGISTYNGQTFLLEYGGPGQLWGFPYDQKDTDGDGTGERWFPLANLKDGTLLGSSSYVVKAIGGEQIMATLSSSECSSLTLSLPSTAVPSASTVVPAPANGADATPTEADTGSRICAPNGETGVMTCSGI